MKKALISFLLLIPLLTFGQTYQLNLKASTLRQVGNYGERSNISVQHLTHKMNVVSNGKVKNEYYLNIGIDSILIDKEVTESLTFSVKSMQDLWNVAIIKSVLCELTEYGTQESMRSEIEEEVLNFINQQYNYGMIFNDPCLENYIYGLIAKIAPDTMIDGRPSNVNLLLLDSPVMNAGMYPNGTLVLNTGLLSALHTEDELVAILAHEIAHFILDHSIQNVNKQVSRKKKAEFWAALATGVTAVAEGVAASKNSYYIPGGATIAMAGISTIIASQVIDRLGMQYNHKQETEADKLAMKTLEILGYNRHALATALNRMCKLNLQERSGRMYFKGYTHPALVDRIKASGIPNEDCDRNFEKEVSFAVTSTARMKYEDRRFRQVLQLVSQNINNNVATSEDYILKANCLMALNNDSESNVEILNLINKAKEIDKSNINIYKSEILANIRLKKFDFVLDLLSSYNEKLIELKALLKDVNSGVSWDAQNRYISIEQDWVNRMSIKIKSMI